LPSLETFSAACNVNRQRLQKLANAAQISFAECALLQDENQLLFKQNDEAKRRWSPKSSVIGRAKVMSFEDIEAAREKRAAKQVARDSPAAKGKRGTKRRTPLPEAKKAKKISRNEMDGAEAEIATAVLGDYCSVFQLEPSTAEEFL
jgi:hypothetical protein